MKNLLQLIVFLVFISGFSQSILDRELVKFEGFFDFYYDTATDKIYLEVEKLDSEGQPCSLVMPSDHQLTQC